MAKSKLNAVTEALVRIDPATHPLFVKMRETGAFTWLAEADEASLKANEGLGLLCLVDDPNMFKETLDMTVLAPELFKLFDGTLSKAWFTDPAIGRELSTKLGIRRLPALAVYLNGELLGVVEGLRNWEEYQVELIGILTAKTKPRKKTLTIAPVQD